MHEEVGAGEPIYLELVDALELYAAIIGGRSAQADHQSRLTTTPSMAASLAVDCVARGLVASTWRSGCACWGTEHGS